MGGGTSPLHLLVEIEGGLSPRGRGNLWHRDHGIASQGSIPAWAGEPREGELGFHLAKVYPRVGGGTYLGNSDQRLNAGLSPRGRGNLEPRRRYFGSRRSIPAWAGEPRRGWNQADRIWVYPRVGGGTLISRDFSAAATGLSPRGRGNLAEVGADALPVRSIPAWAGEPG